MEALNINKNGKDNTPQLSCDGQITLSIKTLNYNTPPLSCRGQITLSNIDESCPLATTKQVSFISMYVPSLVKIPSRLLKLLSRNENMDLSRAGNSV